MPNAITDAAALFQNKGALVHQIRELAKTADDQWTPELNARFEKLNNELNETDRKIQSIHEERETEHEKGEERRLVADLSSVSPQEQVDIYNEWKGGFREWALYGEVRSPRARKAMQRTAALVKSTRAQSLNPEYRDQNIGTPGDGGYLTHPEFSGELVKQMQAYIGVSRVARTIVTATGSPMYWPTTGVDKGEKIDEAGALTADTGADIAFGQKVLNAYKYSSKVVRVSHELLMDSELPIESIVMDRLAERLGRIIEQEATNGDGSGDPNGFVTAAEVELELATAGAPGNITQSSLIDLVHGVDPAYRATGSCAFLMHDTMIGQIRKLDNSTNNLLWQPSAQLGEPDRLYGYPVIPCQEMLAVVAIDANDEKFVVFGDFSKFIMRFVRGVYMQRLNELYAGNGQVGFLAHQRFDCELVYHGAAGTSPLQAISTTVS
jgi:HK97 family phage major capsid protein